jgi:spermidine/putrescine transport system substrate-binding protein
LITWEEYIAPEVIEAFTAKTGIALEIDSFDNAEELTAILRAYPHRYDIVILEDSSMIRFREMELIQPIDKSRLTGFDNLDPKFLDTNNDPQNGYSLPYLWGSTLVAYRNDKIEAPEPSFELLFDESLKGRVLMLDDMYETMSVGHLLEGRSINSHDEPSIRAAAERIKTGVRATDIRFVSDKAVREALGSGEAWAAHCYSGDAALVAEDHPEVSYFFPKEGAALWLDVMAVSSEAPNPENAYTFLDFMLDPEIAAMNANSLWYATPNLNAQPLLDEALVADEALIPPPSVLARCEFFAPSPPEANAVVSKLTREIRNQSSTRAETAALEPAEPAAD